MTFSKISKIKKIPTKHPKSKNSNNAKSCVRRPQMKKSEKNYS